MGKEFRFNWERENEELTAQIKTLKLENKKLGKRITALEAERDALFEENAQISDKESEYELTIQDLTDELRTARAEIANLKGVCKERKTQLTNAVPFEEHADEIFQAYMTGWDDFNQNISRRTGPLAFEQYWQEESFTKKHLDERRKAVKDD